METKRRHLKDFPDLVEAEKRLTELHTERDSTERSTQELLGHLNGAKTETKSRAEAASWAMTSEGGGVAIADAVDVDALRDDLGKTGRQTRIIEAAIEQQKKIIGGHLSEASDAICTEAGDEFRALVATEARLAVELARASAARKAFVEALADEGVMTGRFNTVGWKGVGNLRDQSSGVRYFLRSLVQQDIPIPDIREELNGEPL